MRVRSARKVRVSDSPLSPSFPARIESNGVVPDLRAIRQRVSDVGGESHLSRSPRGRRTLLQ